MSEPPLLARNRCGHTTIEGRDSPMRKLLSLGVIFLAGSGGASGQEPTTNDPTKPRLLPPASAVTTETVAPRTTSEPKKDKAPPVVVQESTPMPAYYAPVGPTNSGRVYGTAEVLLWWMKRGNSNVPPLVTPGDPADTPTGALGQPGTSVIFPGGGGGNDTFSVGGRFSLGIWLNPERTLAVEGVYFFFGSRSNNFTATNSGDPALTTSLNVPFFNPGGGLEDAQ